MANKIKRSQYIPFFIIVFIMGMFNMYGTQSPAIAISVAFIEYFVVFFLLLSGDFSKAFFYYLAFTATILEFDVFISGDSSTSVTRYSFAMLPLFKDYLRWLLAYVFAIKAYNEYESRKYILSSRMKKLKKWLFVLFISGTISIFWGLVLNDNGILNNFEVYPRVAIIYIFQFLVKASIIMTTVFLLCREGWKEQCSCYMQIIILCVALITVIGALLGFVGYYGEKNETIIIASLSVALTPMLILFFLKKDEAISPIVMLLAGVSVIVASFVYGGTAIGSKWYIFIALTIVGVITMIAKIRSVAVLALGGVVILMIVPLIILPLVSLFDVNSYASIKLEQALTTINIFGAQNAADWYLEMNASPLQRFDELHNILIEYIHKPWFALFGKGLGGTVHHYTSLLSWSGLEDFSIDQIRMGAFYSMHESLAVIFLQHGIIGVVFFFKIIVMLLKRLYKTPWAMMGFIWMFFYWDYGVALVIGAVILVLALSEEVDDKQIPSFKQAKNNK